MKNWIYLLVIIFFPSCKNESIPNKNDTDLRKEQLISEFKLVTFQKCLKFGFGKNNQIKELLKEDVSIANDFPLGLSNYKMIDSIARETSTRIRQDSITLDQKYWSKLPEIEAKERRGKRVISICLNLYQSENLDAIAKEKIRE